MISRKWAVVVIGVMSTFGFSGQLFAAGVAAAGAGASAGGSGHASGGGGGGAPSGGTGSGGASSVASHGGGESAGSGGSGTVGIGRVTSSGTTQTPGNTSHTNNDHGHNHGRYPYGVVYPYSPFGYGYGSSDYDNGYGSNGIANTNNSQVTLDPSNNTGGSAVTTDNGPQVTPSDSNVNSQAARAQNAADHSPQLLALQAAVQKDQTDYDAAKNRVLEQLRTQPDYQKAMQDRHIATADVRSTKLTDPNDTNAVVSAAKMKLNAGDTVTKMEQSAIDQDQAAATAKAKLADDMTKLTAMRGSAGIK